jgi:hypothetical protein
MHILHLFEAVYKSHVLTLEKKGLECTRENTAWRPDRIFQDKQGDILSTDTYLPNPEGFVTVQG